MISLQVAEVFTATLKIRKCTTDQTPETHGVIEFREMAELMHNDVIGYFQGKKDYFVIEIQIPLL